MTIIRLYSSTHEKVSVELQERVSDSEFTVLGNMEFDRIFGDFHCVWTVDGRKLPLIKKIREIRRFAEFTVKVI